MEGAVCTLLLFLIAPGAWRHPPRTLATTQIGQSLQSQLLEARRLNEEMESLARQGRVAEAISPAERLLSIHQQVLGPDDLIVARLLNNLAGFYRQTGDYNQAELRYKRSLAIVERKLGPDHPTTALVLNNLAGLYELMGDFVRAEQFLKRTLAVAERGSGPTSLETAKALNALASFYIEAGNYEQAELHLQRAITIFETLSPDSNLAMALNDLGLIQRAKMNYAQAEAAYKRALMIGERNAQAQDPLAASLNGLGSVYEDQGDLVRAQSCYERALTVIERAFGTDHYSVVTLLNNLGLVYEKQGRKELAQPLLERALAIAEKKYGPDSIQLFSHLLNLAAIHFEAGDAATAVQFLTRSFNIRERTLDLVLNAGSEKQKQLYLATLRNETDGILSMMIQAGPDNVAMSELGMTTVLRRKARVLDAMSKQIDTLRTRTNVNSAVLNELADARGRLANLLLQPSTDTLEGRQAYRSTLEKQIEQLEQRVAENSPPARQDAITVSRIQTALPVAAALVEFVSYRPFDPKVVTATERFAGRRYVAFVVRRSGKPVWIDLGDAAAIDDSVTQLRSALKNRKSVNVRDVARALDQQVMQPIRRMLGAVRQIILSPDGELNLLPFGALVDERNEYLIENYSITYVTSGRDLVPRPSSGYQNQNRPVVVANPLFDNMPTGEHTSTARATSRSIDFTKFTYTPLPATALEAKEIATVLNGAEVLTEADATESAVKKVTQPRVLHLATHGFFLSDQKEPGVEGRTLVRERKSIEALENPLLRSGLILAGVTQRSSGPGEDGVLSALEAAGLDLRGTELVVLSACETGVGEIKVGDGVLGLRRALVLAGAKSQVTTLWQVDDAATRDLMVDFYTRLRQGEGKGEALRNAQLNIMKSAGREHPYFWASFIEIGDWGPLNRSALRDY